MKINHRHYILVIFAIATFAISLSGYIFLYKKVKAQAQHSSEARVEVLLGNQKKLQERELTTLYADTQEDRSRVDKYVVSEDKIVNFIETIEKIGSDSLADVEMSSINVEKANSKDKKNNGYINAHLNVRGSWSSVMRALILIENLPYNVDIGHINLVYSGASDIDKNNAKVNEWTLSLDIKVLTAK